MGSLPIAAAHRRLPSSTGAAQGDIHPAPVCFKALSSLHANRTHSIKSNSSSPWVTAPRSSFPFSLLPPTVCSSFLYTKPPCSMLCSPTKVTAMLHRAHKPAWRPEAAQFHQCRPAPKLINCNELWGRLAPHSTNVLVLLWGLGLSRARHANLLRAPSCCSPRTGATPMGRGASNDTSVGNNSFPSTCHQEQPRTDVLSGLIGSDKHLLLPVPLKLEAQGGSMYTHNPNTRLEGPHRLKT